MVNNDLYLQLQSFTSIVTEINSLKSNIYVDLYQLSLKQLNKMFKDLEMFYTTVFKKFFPH